MRSGESTTHEIAPAKRIEIRPVGRIARRRTAVSVGRAGQAGLAGALFEGVDRAETTLRFRQEIYDDQGRLAEVHEKYPVDKGHQQV